MRGRRRQRERPRAEARPAVHDRRGDAERALWLYGRHVVATVLANPRRRVRRLLAVADALEWVEESAPRPSRACRSPRPWTGRRSRRCCPRARCIRVWRSSPSRSGSRFEDVVAAAGDDSIIVLLDRVSDPHNVGAVLRSAAVFGASAVVVPEYGAPEITGALAKAASGAVEHVPLVRVVNLARAMDALKEAGYWCVGLDEEGERPLAGAAPRKRVALALGAEGAGLRRLTRSAATFSRACLRGALSGRSTCRTPPRSRSTS